MSETAEDDAPAKPSVCANFEPQAWRKTICRNCFKAPEMHVLPGTTDTKPASNQANMAVGDDKGVKTAPGEVSKAAATSLKDKYEQLEKDKFKSKEPPKTLPKTKGAGGKPLSENQSSDSNEIIPSNTLPRRSASKFGASDADNKGSSNLMKSKFGSVENVASGNEKFKVGGTLKSMFGSLENISTQDNKKKDNVPIPVQKQKPKSEPEKISKDKDADTKKNNLVNKLDAFGSELKAGYTSKVGPTVIHSQKDGKVDVINLPSKAKVDKKESVETNKTKDQILFGKTDKIENLKDKLGKPELKSSQENKVLKSVDDKSNKATFSKPELKPASVDKDKKSLSLKTDIKTQEKEKPAYLKLLKSPTPDKDKEKQPLFHKPDLKAPAPNEPKAKEPVKVGKLSPRLDKQKTDLKSPLTDEKKPSFLKPELKSPTPDKDSKSPLAKLGLRSPVTDKDRLSEFKSPTPEKDRLSLLKSTLKSPSPEPKHPFVKPELKSPTPDKDKSPAFTKPALKKADDRSDKKDSKFQSSDKDKKATFDKPELKHSSTDKDKHLFSKSDSDKSSLFGKTDLKSKSDKDAKSGKDTLGLKSVQDKSDLKSIKTGDKTDKPENIYLKGGLKKTDTANKVTDDSKKDSLKTDTKNKFELPSLKSSKPDAQKDNKVDSKTNRFEPKVDKSKDDDNKLGSKFKFNKPEPKSTIMDDKEKTGQKNRFEPPKLKSSKPEQQNDTTSKIQSKFNKTPELKTQDTDKAPLRKWQKPEPKQSDNDKTPGKLGKTDLKSSKDDSRSALDSNRLKSSKPEETDKKNDYKSKFEKPALKSSKDDKKTPISPENDKSATKSDLQKHDDHKLSKLKDDTKHTSTNTSHEKHISKITDSNKDNTSKDTDAKTLSASAISNERNFDDISSDGAAISGEDVNACAVNSTGDSSHVHVDTQVFTSSRNKTAGVAGIASRDLHDTADQSKLSGLNRSQETSQDTRVKDKNLQNGNVSTSGTTDTIKNEISGSERKASLKITDSDVEKLRSELLEMTERCSNLETENEMLKTGLSKKEKAEAELKKQKDEVEVKIKSLHGQLKSMEQTCNKLESDNSNLLGDLKAQHETAQVQPKTSKTEETDDKMAEKERIMEEMLDENIELKSEIQDLKIEMEEMYDSFRDQEAEEFRELQKELEITAKNCRILQFKLRKVERRNDQVEKDRDQFEDKLRALQDQFQDRDAVTHIHSLEVELRMAKDVSVRLHDELDLMEDKRGKVEEENRHLTDLLEQADRKQFRLEMEVDKLRDKIIEVKQELRASGAANNGEPRKESLESVGRQSSTEMELQNVLRDLFDSREREADLRDQLQFLSGDAKMLHRKIRCMEDENDNLLRQLKKMTIEQASAKKPNGDANGSPSKSEAEIELNVQYELMEKELCNVKRRVLELEEENEMLHNDMFNLEHKVKEKDKQLQVIPEPTSPRAYYEDKIKEYEKQSDEFRRKILEKETEVEQLYAKLHCFQTKSKHTKDLRKAKSLDSESDYKVVVDLKRQLELSHQECSEVRTKLTELEQLMMDKERDANEACETNDNQVQDVCIGSAERQSVLVEDERDITDANAMNEHQEQSILSVSVKGDSAPTDSSEYTVTVLDEGEFTITATGQVDSTISAQGDVESINTDTGQVESTIIATGQVDSIVSAQDKVEPIITDTGQVESTIMATGQVESTVSAQGLVESTVTAASQSESVVTTQGEDQSNPSIVDVIYESDKSKANLRTQLSCLEDIQASLAEKIANLTNKFLSLAKPHFVFANKHPFSSVTKTETPVEIIKPSDSSSDNNPNVIEQIAHIANSSLSRDNSKHFSRALSLNSWTHVLSDECIHSNKQTIPGVESTPRDPDELLSIIDALFCKLVQLLYEMESADKNIVPTVSGQADEFDTPENTTHSDKIPSSNKSDTDVHVPLISKLTDDNKLASREQDDNSNGTCVVARECPADASGKCRLDNVLDIKTFVADDANANPLTPEVQKVKPISEMDIVAKTVSSEAVSEKVSCGIEKDSLLLQKRIVDLQEQIDDLRLIIKAKEEKYILLEEELSDSQSYLKSAQDNSRRREVELIQDMDLIHGKNEILNNLLEIVTDRAEAAEEELERLITEFNEAQDSSVSSEKGATGNGAARRLSCGSDDVFDGSPTEKQHVVTVWEEQLKKRVASLETLLAEERKKVSSLEKKLEINGSDVISSAMSDDAKLHMREKELLQSELQESQRHAKLANEHIRTLSERLKKVETDKWRSPKFLRKPAQMTSTSKEESTVETKDSPGQDTYCKSCAELQTVKDQLYDELMLFKEKATELEHKVEEVGEACASKNSATDQERQLLDQRFKQKVQDCKKVEEQLGKLREEDRKKDIFIKERDNTIRDKSAQIVRKDELIQEQEEIIHQREEDLQALFDQISQREKTLKEQTEMLRKRDEVIKEKDEKLKDLTSQIEEKSDELHYLEEEMNESVLKRKESETLIAEMKEKMEETNGKSEMETENERLQSDIDNLMGNITGLHTDKVTLENELDKAKQALSEAMLMWDRDRSTLGCDLNIAREKMQKYQITAKQKESQALQTLRVELNAYIESKEKIAHELRLAKMEHENTVRVLKMERYKLTEELTSKIRMLTHEMSNNDKMSDELSMLRGQDDINYQLHHHEKILRAEYMAMKVRYESQLERLQKEHLQLLAVVERLQREKNLDQEIIVGIQKGMANIRQTYTHDLTRWKDERNVLDTHISQIEEGKEIAQNLREQIIALKHQLNEQEVERTELVNKMTSERRAWDMEKARLTSSITQLEEQLAVFIQVQSKSKDVQYRMETTWERERAEQKRLLTEAHNLAMELQDQLHRRDEAHARERKALMDQLDRNQKDKEDGKLSKQKLTLELNTGDNRIKHLEQEVQSLKEMHKQEQDFWTKERNELLRRLAEMRKIHNRDVRRIDDVLASLNRLRELAAIVIETEQTATSSSMEAVGTTTSGDASAASASVTTGDIAIDEVKQNVDQVILKYIKESLRQIHFAAEELSRPVVEPTREERQKLRRSLSSSEIELLKDEFILGPSDTGKIVSYREPLPDIKSHVVDGENHVLIQRRIINGGIDIRTDPNDPEPIESISTEQTSSYNDDKDTHVEVHRIKTTKDVTRVETTVKSLPKPPRTFFIPRSRSTSPGPNTHSHPKAQKGVAMQSAPVGAHHYRFLNPKSSSGSRSSSADSSPLSNAPEHGFMGTGVIQSGSLDNVSPGTARKNFFESENPSSLSYMSWPERNRKLETEKRNSRSLTNTSDLHTGSAREFINGDGKGTLRNSLSLDDGSLSAAYQTDSPKPSTSAQNTGMVTSHPSGKHSGLKNMFSAMKRKLKRSQSAREPNLDMVVEGKVVGGNHERAGSIDCVDQHTVHERMTPIDIPDDAENGSRESRKDDNQKKDKSKSSKKTPGDSDSSRESTFKKLKKHFRSKSVDRSRDRSQERHVTPILVGHLSGSHASDSEWQFSETKV